MIVEQRTYKLHIGKAPEFFRIYEELVMNIQLPILGNMIGYFTTDIGPLNEIVHLWGFVDHRDRTERRDRLAANVEWQKAVAHLHPLIISMENKILLPAPYSPIGGVRPAKVTL